MSKLYQVYHTRRITTMAGGANVLKHNLRSVFQDQTNKEVTIPDYLDKDYMSQNMIYGCKNSKDFFDEYNRIIQQANLKRKIQKNSSRVIETVVSFSEDFCKDWKINESDKKKIIDYFNDCINWEQERRGNVILSVTCHWDEKTPHAHILAVPLVRTKNKTTQEEEWKYSSSEYIGNRQVLRQTHSDFYNKVGKKYGLVRGEYGTRATHKELRDYKKWETEQREMLEERIATNFERAKELAFSKKKIEQEKEYFKELRKAVSKNPPEIPEPPVTLNKRKTSEWLCAVQKSVAHAFQAIQASYHMLRRKYNSLVDAYNKVQTENVSLKAENNKIRKIIDTTPLSDIEAYRAGLERNKVNEGQSKNDKTRRTL